MMFKYSTIFKRYNSLMCVGYIQMKILTSCHGQAFQVEGSVFPAEQAAKEYDAGTALAGPKQAHQVFERLRGELEWHVFQGHRWLLRSRLPFFQILFVLLVLPGMFLCTPGLCVDYVHSEVLCKVHEVRLVDEKPQFLVHQNHRAPVDVGFGPWTKISGKFGIRHGCGSRPAEQVRGNRIPQCWMICFK